MSVSHGHGFLSVVKGQVLVKYLSVIILLFWFSHGFLSVVKGQVLVKNLSVIILLFWFKGQDLISYCHNIIILVQWLIII